MNRRLLRKLRRSVAAGYLGWIMDPTSGLAQPVGTEGIHLPILATDPADLADGDEWAVAGYRRARIAGATVNLGATGGSSHPADLLTDDDGDTKIQVEESVDEDIIRFDIAGNERMVLDADALRLYDSGGTQKVAISADTGHYRIGTGNPNDFEILYFNEIITDPTSNVTGIWGTAIQGLTANNTKELVGMYAGAAIMGAHEAPGPTGLVVYVTTIQGPTLTSPSYGMKVTAALGGTTLTDHYGIYLESDDGDGSITNEYGLFIGTPDTGMLSTNYFPIYQAETDGENYLLATTYIPSLIQEDVKALGDSTTEIVARRTHKDLTATLDGATTGDMTLLYTEHTHAADADYEVEIDGAGDEQSATFKWRVDAGAWTTGVVMVNSRGALVVSTLQNNVKVKFKKGNFTLADNWTWTAIDTGAQVEVFKVDTTNAVVSITGATDIVHAAIEDDDYALEIDVAAGNFRDIKAIDIVYVTGSLEAGEDDEAILVNIDEDDSTGGRITGLDVLTTTSGDALVEALFAGVGVAPIEQLSGTFDDPDSALVKAANELADLINDAANTTVFVADNDTMTIGKSAKFEELEFILSTDAGGGGIAPTFEYSTGIGTWGDFSPMDGTNGLRNSGVIAWEDSDIPGWNTGLATEYLIRITRTRGTVPTTPVVSFLQCASATEFSWDESGDVIINSLSTDTISERTAAAGVTIETVELKDGLVDGVDIAARDHAEAHGPSVHTGFDTWKVIYTDAAGDQQEVALGADATVLAGAGAAAAPVFEEVYASHIAVFISDGEDLTAASLNPRRLCVGESGEHGTFTAIPRAKATAGTAGAGTNTILIEADDNPAFSSPTVLMTLALNTSTEVDDTSLDNAWASGDIWIRARCTAVNATAPKDVVVFFYYKERVEAF